MKKNILNIPITKEDKILIILRAVPGAGKSTLANRLVNNGIIHSTDAIIEENHDYNEFFSNMVKNKDFTPLHDMHKINNINIKKSIDKGISPIIIDNTNLRPSEPKEAIEYALKQGYADDNIEFIELGTAGLTSEELHLRNTHNVPLDKIKSMIDTYNGHGKLTLEKVIKAKPIKGRKISYSAVVLDDKSKTKLLSIIAPKIPTGWRVITHHMTISFGKGLSDDMLKDKNKSVNLIATDIGISKMAIAVKVIGYPSDNKIPHITIAVNEKNGGKPVMSNDITNWVKLDNDIRISGLVKEIYK